MPLLCPLLLATLAVAPDEVPPQNEFPAREYRQNGVAEHVAVAAGDLNGDGFDDVVSTSAFARLRLWLGRYLGGLESAGALVVDAPVVALDLGDVDGDGALDIAFTTGTKVFVSLGTGAAQFGAPLLLGFVNDGVAIAAEDLDGDGLDDVCVLSRGNGKLKAWIADPAGGFAPAVSSALADAPEDFDLADLDQDGFLDAVIASTGTDTVVVAAGLGSGAFDVVAEYPATGNGLTSIALGDVNGDGAVDAVITDSLYWEMRTLLGQGDGTFGPAAKCGSAERVELFDWDSDGQDERISMANGVRVYAGWQVCEWVESLELPASKSCTSVAPLDANGDGHLDFAIGCASLIDEPSQTGDDFTTVGLVLGDGRGGVLDVLRIRKDPAQGATTTQVVEDLNDDAILDVLGVDDVADVVSVRYGTGSAALGPPQVLSIPGVSKLRVSDLDGDGDRDLVAVAVSGLFTSLNQGGKFATPVRVAPIASFTYWTTGDLNGDGLEDVVFVSGQAGTFSRLSRGDGTFTAPIPSPEVVYPGQANGFVRISDLDGDAFGDVVLAAWQGGIWSYRGTGSGNFVPAGFVPPELYWTGFQVGDLDGDGLEDLVVSKTWPCLCNLNSVLTFLSDGSGGFEYQGEYEIARELYSIRLHDMNADGSLDLLAQSYERVVALAPGTGTGGFLPPKRYGAWGWVAGIGHANLDNKVDVVTFPVSAQKDDVEVQFVLQR